MFLPRFPDLAVCSGKEYSVWLWCPIIATWMWLSVFRSLCCHSEHSFKSAFSGDQDSDPSPVLPLSPSEYAFQLILSPKTSSAFSTGNQHTIEGEMVLLFLDRCCSAHWEVSLLESLPHFLLIFLTVHLLKIVWLSHAGDTQPYHQITELLQDRSSSVLTVTALCLGLSWTPSTPSSRETGGFCRFPHLCHCIL